MIKEVGKSSDGKTIVSGVYRFYETFGLPLEVVLELLLKKNIIPCWVSFYDEAIKAGMKSDRIISKLEEAICDVYGVEFGNVVVKKLNKLSI